MTKDFDQRQAEYTAKVERIIAQHGWMVQAVFGGSGAPGFHYTVGLFNKGLPELLVFGMPVELGYQLLNDAASHLATMKETGADPQPGPLQLEQWRGKFWLVTASAHQVQDYAFRAISRSEGKASFLQLCLPDRHGKFAWEPTCETQHVMTSPTLGTPPPTLH